MANARETNRGFCFVGYRKGAGIAAFFQRGEQEHAVKVQKLEIPLDDESCDTSEGVDDENDDILGPSAESYCSDETVLKSVPGPADLSQTPNSGPTQPYSRRYPTHEIGGIKCHFNYKWFNIYPWMEYSKLTDAAYCY